MYPFFSKKDSSRHLYFFLLFSGLTASVLGLLGIFDVRFETHLVSFSAAWAPLQYATALGVFMTGMGLLAFVSNHSRVTTFIGVTHFIFAMYSLSPNASLSFIACGIVFIFQGFKWSFATTVTGLSSSVVFSIGAVSLLGFLANYSPGYKWGNSAPIPPIAAITFFLAGIGGYFMAFQKQLETKQSLTRWIPLQVFSGLMLSVILLFLSLLERERSFLPQAVLFIGAIFSSLFSFLAYLGIVSREKAVELQNSQKEILKAKEEALQASQLKSEFLTNMSHEIRTPMNAVMGLTELLEDTSLSSEQKKHIQAIRFSAESLLGILNEVLDLAKIEAGKMELENCDFDLKQLLSSTIKVFEPQARQKRLKLVFDYSDEAPKIFKGDPTRIRQVVMNFLSNALKFTYKGRIELKVQHSHEQERRCLVHVSVKDTGIGIPEDRREKIFQTFSQADNSTTRKFGGTGLGLSISKKLIELMQGKAGYDSEEGVGSTFFFTIPLELGLLVVAAEKRSTPSRSPHALRILIAEDNDISRRVLSKTVGKMGHLVDTVQDGVEVLSALEHIQYDLILMDCQMPKMDGYEAANRIRLMEERAPGKGRTPILALTAHAMVSDRKRCLDAGMDEYLAKPFKNEDLRRLIDELTWRKETSDGVYHASNRGLSSLRKVPVIDKAIVQSVIELHDEENGFQFFSELLEIFKKTTPKAIRSLRRTLQNKDLERTAEIAHSLKSSSSNMGAMRLFYLTEKLERSAKSGSLKGSLRTIPQVEKEFERALEEIQTILTELKTQRARARRAA